MMVGELGFLVRVYDKVFCVVWIIVDLVEVEVIGEEYF